MCSLMRENVHNSDSTTMLLPNKRRTNLKTGRVPTVVSLPKIAPSKALGSVTLKVKLKKFFFNFAQRPYAAAEFFSLSTNFPYEFDSERRLVVQH